MLRRADSEIRKMAQITRFAWVIDEASPRSDEVWDQEILRTDRFVAVPSAGSLVAGWTLVVPRRPMLNLAQADATERDELEAIITKIAGQLSATGDVIFCFEHGSGWRGSATGCGVDQAHLHIVPLPFDLLEAAAERRDDAIDWQPAREGVSPLAALPAAGEYVALWSATQQPMVGNVRRPISQWIRRVIAEKLGIGAEWNYRSHPQTDRVRQTLKMLAALQPTPAR
jgi:ATP adenylyltransferase